MKKFQTKCNGNATFLDSIMIYQSMSRDADSGTSHFTMNGGSSDEVGTPDSGTTQSASSKTDSANYSSFAEMLAAYQADIAEIQAGDERRSPFRPSGNEQRTPCQWWPSE